MSQSPSSFHMKLRKRILGPWRFSQFARSPRGGIWGVYDSFDHARAEAPKTKPFGYDFPELAHEYAEQLATENWEESGQLLRTADYPILFWLSRLGQAISGRISLVDLGGNVGVHYYAYLRLLQDISRFDWQVLDVPSMTSVGEKIAQKRGASSLSFITNPADALGGPILFASGAIHYLSSLPDLISKLPKKPDHILFNRVPLYDGPTYVTLQNGGFSFYPQYVFNRSEFLKSLCDLGYCIQDQWRDYGESVVLPFYPERCISHCVGLYLTLENPR